MTDKSQLNKAYQIILEKLIATGKAPNYAQLAAELGIPAREGQLVLRKLFSKLGFPGWFQPKNDDIASFAPFNNIPTNYRLTIDGMQKWFGQ